MVSSAIWRSPRGQSKCSRDLECHVVFAPCANDGCDWKLGAWGEDVFAHRCMDHHYVDKVEAFDVATDGACKADRPEGEKSNSHWFPKDCSQVSTVTAHPFKKPADYEKFERIFWLGVGSVRSFWW